MSRSLWISAHLYYHADLAVVIRRLVGPLTHELQQRDAIKRVFFVRYWQRGPHLRLRLLPARARERASVQRELERSVAAFFARYPAPHALDPIAFSRTAAALSRFEYSEERLEPLAQNNSLAYEPYEPDLDRFGGPTARLASEKQFADSSALAIALIERDRPITLGVALAYQILALAACDIPLALLPAIGVQLQESYGRSLGVPAARVAEVFAARYAAEGDAVEQLMRQLLRAVVQPERVSLDPLSVLWSQSIRRLYRRLRALQRDGRLSGSPEGQQLPDDSHAIVLRCLHLHHNRLGIKLLEEAYLGFLMAEAVGAVLPHLERPARV